MDIEELHRTDLTGASSVLVLAPLSPWGTQAYVHALSARCLTTTNLAVVTYTQPPELWLTDWERHADQYPAEIVFIHGGPTAGEKSQLDGVAIATERVSPAEPMEIISAVTRTMDTWKDSDAQAVVSVQTLTVLLEYVDFDTAFRYLHVLIHRIRGAGARGYFQMDPSIHEPETINTLSVLFDVVIQAERGDDGETEWSIVSAMSETSTDPSLAIGPIHPPEEEWGLPRRLVMGMRSRVERVWQRLHARVSDTPVEKPEVGSREDPPTSSPEPEVEDESLLTDDERIKRLLEQAGGRMSQSDIVENTHWSGPSVSRKLSDMEGRGLITRVQVGRGNLVFLEGHQPDIASSGVQNEERTREER